jgi:hypothetical protein
MRHNKADQLLSARANELQIRHLHRWPQGTRPLLKRNAAIDR